MGKNTAVIVSAGNGIRMETEKPKQYLTLGDRPILAHTLQVFQDSVRIDDIIVVAAKDRTDYVYREVVEKYGFSKVSEIVQGGGTRCESVYNGLKACRDTDYVLIHDGVRPFVTEDIIRRGLEAAGVFGNAVCGMPSKDTIRVTNAVGQVQQTPMREMVWLVQTPQIFSYPLIMEAYKNLLEEEAASDLSYITDDGMVLEWAGGAVHMIRGAYRNLKITTPEDLKSAEALL